MGKAPAYVTGTLMLILCVAPVRAQQPSGAYSVEPAPSDGIIYVATTGNDSNDGLSWGTAKATPDGAEAALPSTGGRIQMSCGTFAVSRTFTATKPTAISGCAPAKEDGTAPATKLTTLSCPAAVPCLSASLLTRVSGLALAGQGSGTGLDINHPYGTFEGLNIYNFATGILLDSNAYLFGVINSSIHDNTKNMATAPNALNWGENISFINDLFSSKAATYSATCVDFEAPGYDAHFYATSLDECGITLNAQGRLFLDAVHMENPVVPTATDFITVGPNGAVDQLSVDHSMFLEDYTSPRSEFIGIAAGATVFASITNNIFFSASTMPQVLYSASSNTRALATGNKVNNVVTAMFGGSYTTMNEMDNWNRVGIGMYSADPITWFNPGAPISAQLRPSALSDSHVWLLPDASGTLGVMGKVTVGKVACVKATGVIGSCSSQPDATGACACQ